MFNKTYKSIIENISKGHKIIEIFYDDGFTKTKFVNELIQYIDNKIIYVDFDLLYNGYININSIKHRDNVTIINPTNHNIINIIKSISVKLTSEKYVVVLDSLNGFCSILDNKDEYGLRITYTIMLFSSLAKVSGSVIILPVSIESKNSFGFTLSSIGAYIVEPKNITSIII